MASSARGFNGRFADIEGGEALSKLFAKIPDKVQQPGKTALEAWGGEIVSTYKGTISRRSGNLADSAHLETDNGRGLSVSVVIDAKDDNGRYYAGHVEYGHKAADGSHVPAKPALWPAYQATKRKGRAGVSKALKDGVAASST